MQTLKRSRLIAVATTAFLGGVIFASSMDWTELLVAQSRGAAPVDNIATPGRGDVQGGFATIAEQVTPAVVAIQAERDARPSTNSGRGRGQGQGQLPPGIQQFFGLPDDGTAPQASSGSGFIVSKDGYVLTNNHVVEGMDRIQVALTDHRVFKARIVGRDPQTDVAVIKIDGTNLPAVTLGDDAATKVGEWVLAIGNPMGLDFTVTAGIVSAKGRSRERQLAQLQQSRYSIQDFIQTDAAINPGNSGGPLVNARGEVIAINSAIASRTGTYVGYGFAIPITLAKTVMDDIIAHGRVRRAVMGASMNDVTPEDAAINGMKEIYGAKIEQMTILNARGERAGDSPAEKAGIEIGDVVIAANGTKVDRVSTLQRLLRSQQPGDVVSLDVLRYGSKRTFKVKLAEAPADEDRTVAAASRRENDSASGTSASINKVGISVEVVTPRLAERAGLTENMKGVMVTSVTPGSSAEGRLFPNDVIVEVRVPSGGSVARSPVASVAELQRELGKVKDGQYVSLLVMQPAGGGTTQSRIVNLRVGD
jgi:serine protease Do